MAHIPEDYHTADGKPTCGYEYGGYGACRRDPGHGGDHYDANGNYFKTKEANNKDASEMTRRMASDVSGNGHWYTR